MKENQKKIALVTGANSGIGFETAKGLARLDYKVILVCRDATKGEEALKLIKASYSESDVELMLADLSSQTQIRSLVKQYQENYSHLDVLVNNAAVWPKERILTEDKLELQLAVNHLAPFLLTNLLLDTLMKSTAPRVVTLSSKLHFSGKIILENLTKTTESYSAYQTYNDTKLMNVMFTLELASLCKNKNITVNCLHPGVIASNLFRSLPFGLGSVIGIFLKSTEDGAKTSLYLATSDAVKNISGKYFEDCKEKKPHACSSDTILRKELWQKSLQLTGLS